MNTPPIPVKLSSIEDVSHKPGIKTPTQYPFPVFFMCPPVYVDTAVKNNPTMDEYASKPMDKEKFLAQWYNFYNVLAGNSMVYLITPWKGLQDSVYVNCGVYLPHITDRDIIILSNFTAEGRDTEEDVAGVLWRTLGYELFDCPFKFEGYPELKWMTGAKAYLGGYGFRTDPKAYQWLEREFGCKIIPIRETDEVLYHLDCSAMPIGKENVLLCTEIMDEGTVKQIEKVCNVIPVTKADSYAGICNSLQVGSEIFNASSLKYMKKTDKEYIPTRTKDENLEAICRRLGMEIIFMDLSESEKSGAKLSCMVMPANYIF